MPHETLTRNVVPLFCGGTLITGFFGWEKSHYEDFVNNLIQITGTTPRPGICGVYYAITNSQQKIAAEFLERLGFKKVIVTDKYGPLDEEGKPIHVNGSSRSTTSSPCITWVGDWFRDVYPAINLHLLTRSTERLVGKPSGLLRSQIASILPEVALES